jgi:hypothetical protein
VEIRGVMLKMIKYYYYFIFFNAYWSSFDIGENDVPRQNAIFYMSLLEIFFIGGVSFTLHSFDVINNLNLLILGGVAIMLLLNYTTLSKAKFDDKFDEYKFLYKRSKRSRLSLFFAIIIGVGLLNIVGAFLFAS